MVKNYLELCRVSNLPTVWTNVLAACILAESSFVLSNFLLLSLSFSCFYAAGMCLNDLWDAEADRKDRPARPIPSGRVSPRGAAILTALLFASALALLSLAPYGRALPAGVLLIAVIIAYDRFHKRHPLSVLLMAASRLLVFIIAPLAVTGTAGSLPATAGGVQFVYVLAISLTARHEHDRREPYAIPVVPLMISFISLLDGVLLALAEAPGWLGAGVAGMVLTMAGQRFVRGD